MIPKTTDFVTKAMPDLARELGKGDDTVFGAILDGPPDRGQG